MLKRKGAKVSKSSLRHHDTTNDQNNAGGGDWRHHTYHAEVFRDSCSWGTVYLHVPTSMVYVVSNVNQKSVSGKILAKVGKYRRYYVYVLHSTTASVLTATMYVRSGPTLLSLHPPSCLWRSGMSYIFQTAGMNVMEEYKYLPLHG